MGFDFAQPEPLSVSSPNPYPPFSLSEVEGQGKPSPPKPQNNRPPLGTGKSGAISTTCPPASGKPSVSTSDIIGPI
ncbi:hypothetical protein SPKIRA_26390 [Sphingomonas paucimobilis]|nr:hypothetical protein SPKIRA_26390 [Sphingomonas paucimobilis]